MNYLISALIIIGAFFSFPTQANENLCPDGSSFNPDSGMCEVPAGVSPGITTCSVFSASYGYQQSTTDIFPGFEDYPAENCSSTASDYLNNFIGTSLVSGFTIHTCNVISLATHISGDITRASGSAHCNSTHNSRPDINPDRTHTIYFTATTTFDPQEGLYCPPDNPNFNDFDYFNSITETCGRPPQLPPCDCSNLQGSNSANASSGANYRAPVGQYTRETPPPCLNITDPTTGQQCACGVVTNNWLTTSAGNEIIDGQPVPHERWETLGGTFTGGTCGAEDTAPGENETCFTLQNGTQWCLGDPDMECQIINGLQQCNQGCGYFNDDFVCFDTEDSGTPDPDDTNQNPIDDNINDPNKSINDMVKSDFKDISSGTEQRLDNINISIGNQNNRIDGTNNRLDKANQNLEGIGRQLDGIGKEVKGIGDSIDGAFGDDGQGTGEVGGTCTAEGICSWYESAYPDGLVGIWQQHSDALNQTAMFGFLNQFNLDPVGTQPDFSMCFNLGALGDFGCQSFEIPAIIWNFVFICIQITAIFLCRRLIFGG